MSKWIMSPQAHRRLIAHLTESELRDLASEIVRDLGLGEEERTTVFRTLTAGY